MMTDTLLRNYLKSGRRFVSGWLEPGAAETICALSAEQRKAQIQGGVAEIGVHHGKLFIVLYLLCEGEERAVAVDLFSHQELNIDRSGAGNLEVFKRNLSKYADTSHLIVHEGDSTKLAGSDLITIARGPLRLISIDGGHTAEITAHDLETAENALCQGGIIVLDDCFNENWPGVCEGVFRYFSRQRAVVPFAIGSGKTFFCHPAYTSRYAGSIREMDVRCVEREFLGQPTICLDFEPTPLAVRIGRNDAWRKMKNFPPLRAARSLYHTARSLRSN